MGWEGALVSVAMMGAGLISSLFSKQTISQTDPVIGSIRIVTSAFGLVRPVLYGNNRINGNMIWYGDYTATPHTNTTTVGGKGGGQTYEQTSWTYAASFALGLCEGPIAYVVKGWAGDKNIDFYPATSALKSFVNLNTSLWTIKDGDVGQTAWSYLSSQHPTQALKYPNLAYVAVSSFDLGSNPNLPNFSFIIEGLCNYWGDQSNIAETHPFNTSVTVIKAGKYVATNSVVYSNIPVFIDVAPVYVDDDTFTLAAKATSLFAAGRTVTIYFDDSSSTSATIQSSSYGAGLTTVNLNTASAAANMISVTVEGGPHALVEVPSAPGLGEYAVSSGIFTFNVNESGNVTIDYDYLVSVGGNPADIIADIITNSFYGLGLSSSIIDLNTYEFENYCLANEYFLSPVFQSQSQAKDVVELLLKLTNSTVIWGDNKIIVVPLGDAAATSSYASWTPDMSAVVQLTYDDILDEGENSLIISRSTSRDACNHVAIQHVNQDNDYNVETTEYQDQGDIVTNGKRSLGTISANGIVTKTLALKMGRMLCKRTMTARNVLKFSLPLNFIYLRPMDIVGLTSAHHGLYQMPIRITNLKISQVDIQVEAEDLGLGSMTVPTVDAGGDHGGYAPNKLVDPGDANTPIIFVPPLSLANYEIWLATAGGANWGGCHVWVSQDGDTYKRVGTMIGGCRYGALTAELPSILASPDETNTLAVDLTDSGGALTGGTEAEADSLRTLCYVDGEYLAFRDATLTDPYEYDLEYLVRGCYGTAMALHEIGSSFIRIDDAIFKYPITSGEIGQTIYVKLQSFNIHGMAVQDLSDLDAYTYTIESPGSQVSRGFSGLTIGNNSVTPASKVDVAYDSCDHLSSTGDVYSANGQGFTIDLGTTGLNGLDTGSLAADTWYYLYSIANAVQGTVGGLASLSASTPSLPTGYTHQQLVGAIRTDGSGNLMAVNQVDYDCLYETNQQQDTDTTSENWTDQDLGNLVPSISTRAYLTLQVDAGASSVDMAARKNGSSSSGQIFGTVTGDTVGSCSGWVDTDVDQVVELYISTAPDSWTLSVNGYRISI